MSDYAALQSDLRKPFLIRFLGICCIALLQFVPPMVHAHDEEALIDSIARAREMAVKIIVSKAQTSTNPEPGGAEEFTRSFRRNFPELYEGGSRSTQIGAGLILDNQGLVVSSAHLLRDALRIEVELESGETLAATAIGFDNNSDIALLKIPLQHDIQLPRIAPLSSIRVGQPVFAIGAPFGFSGSATSGIVSAIRTRTGFLQKAAVIQTDVAVNPGNSGGPLFNHAGEVIGITTQIMSTNGGFQGVSFAVSMDNVMKLVKRIQQSARNNNDSR